MSTSTTSSAAKKTAPKAASKTDKTITIKLKKGLIGCPDIHRRTALGLGLRNREQVRTLENTSAVRGMIKKIIHLLEIVSDNR